MDSPFKDKMGKRLSREEAIEKIFFRLESYWIEFITAFLWWFSFIPSHSLRKLAFSISGLKIKSKSYIHMGCRVYDPRGIRIGSGSIIGNYATLDGRDELIIGDHVDIASEVMIYNAQHDISSPEFEFVSQPVEIKDYVFIGPRSIILPGVTIGFGAVVAAGAVVSKDVEEKAIVAGVPAREIGKRELKSFNYRLGRARLFQ